MTGSRHHIDDGPTPTGATRAVAEFATREHELDGTTRGIVGDALIDTVAVAVAGTHQPGPSILRRWAGAAEGPCTLWGRGVAAPSGTAALLNATAAHALDWDDVSPSIPLHPSAVLFPALLARLEAAGAASGQRLATAYHVGAAVLRATATALPDRDHYARGWHTSATVGRLAAVAALAHLERMSVAATGNALGLVASLSAGSLANFGTMTKSLHLGVAARDAVMAVELTMQGFTADRTELDHPAGFFARFGDAGHRGHERLDDALREWSDRWPRDWALKVYPTCYGTHRALDAVLNLRDRLGDRPVGRVEIVLQPEGTRPLRPAEPTTGLEAKFSLPWSAALALRRGALSLADFTDDAVAGDTATRTLARRITVCEAAHPPVGPDPGAGGFAVVRVVPTDGEELTERVDVTRGDSSRPISAHGLRAKVADCCATGGMGPGDAERITEGVREVDSAAGWRALRGLGHDRDGMPARQYDERDERDEEAR